MCLVAEVYFYYCHCGSLFPFSLQAKFESETLEVAGSQFSVSQQESSAKTAVLENALDIKVAMTFSNITCTIFFTDKYQFHQNFCSI